MTKNAVAKTWTWALGQTEGGTYNSVDIGDPPAVSLAVSGTLPGSTEDEIKLINGKTTILGTTGDTWLAAGAAFNAVRQDILNDQTASTTTTNGWNNEVRDNEPVTSVVRTDDNTVTITWSAAASYDISVAEEISHNAPASALVTSIVALVGSPDSTINAVVGGMSITSATGTKSNDSAVTVNGAQFGTKTTAAPELDDRIDNISVYSALNDGDTIPTGGASDPWDDNSFTQDLVKFDDNAGRQRHQFSTAQYKATNTKAAHMDGFVFTTKTDQMHVSWWFFSDTDFEGVDKTLHSSKFMRFSDSSDSINLTSSWTQNQLLLFDNPTFPFNQNADTFGTAAPEDEFNFFEQIVDFNTETVKAMVNNVAIYNGPLTSSTTMQFDEIRRMGWESGGTESFPISWRMSDIFADNTLSRVRLGDASTFSACTFFEEQPASSWSATAINITLNRGQLPTGTAWLYVVDADGNTTPGFAITIVD